jgi:hypothetical protein
MTVVTIFGDDGKQTDIKAFNFRFQARTWLLLNGYLFDSNGMKVFAHINNGSEAILDSRLS